MDQNKTLPHGLETPDRRKQTLWIKAIGLSLATLLSFGLTWVLAAKGFSNGHGLAFWVYPSVVASFSLVFLTLLSIVNPNRYLLWGVNVAVLAWYLAVFPRDWFVAGAGVLFFALMFLFESRIREDEKSRADFSLYRILRYCLPVTVYGLLIIVGANVYTKTKVEFENNPQVFFNQIGFYAARGLEHVPSGFGNFNPNQSFDEFVIEQAKRENPEIVNAPPSIQKQGLEEVKRQLEERFSINVNGNPLLGQVVAGAVSAKIQDASEKYQQFFPLIFALIAVALLRTLAFVFVWLTYAISWLVFKILMLFGFFRIGKVQVEVSKLEI